MKGVVSGDDRRDPVAFVKRRSDVTLLEDSIGVVRTSAFLTIRCGVASCQRRDDWSRVKDRLNQSCVRGIFVPYLSLSFRVQVPGGPPGVPKFNYQGRSTVRRSSEFHAIELLRTRVWL